jgi:hypothetical protein
VWLASGRTITALRYGLYVVFSHVAFETVSSLRQPFVATGAGQGIASSGRHRQAPLFEHQPGRFHQYVRVHFAACGRFAVMVARHLAKSIDLIAVGEMERGAPCS